MLRRLNGWQGYGRAPSGYRHVANGRGSLHARHTVDANICLGHLADERDYGVGAQILREIGVHKMRLMTNNPVKRVGLEAYGLEITENVAIETTPNPYNERYLRTKKERMGHTLHFNK